MEVMDATTQERDVTKESGSQTSVWGRFINSAVYVADHIDEVRRPAPVELETLLDLRPGETVELADPEVSGLCLWCEKRAGEPLSATWYLHPPFGLQDGEEIVGEHCVLGDALFMSPAEARTLAKSHREQV